MYGSDGKGDLFYSMRRHGKDHLYCGSPNGFISWLEFVLDPTNFEVLGEDYSGRLPKLFGFQTHRLLMMSFCKPIQALKEIYTREDLRHLWQSKKIHSHVLMNETLNSDLGRLISGPLRPFIKDEGSALADLRAAKRINVSRNFSDQTILDVPRRLKELVRDREWLIYEKFYA